MSKKILKIIGLVLIVFVIIIGTVYLIDLDRMKKNKKVLFSTWGFDYANPENNYMESYTENETQTNTILNNIDYSNEKLKIEELPEEYSYIQAIQDKCVISSQGLKVYNKDELDTFLNNVNNNEPYSIRTINYTVEGDMMITDVNFEGNNVFSTCCDWTRDKFSSKEDRTYRYGKFSKLVIEQANGMTYILLQNKIEGDLEEVTVTYYNDNAKSINNYDFKYLLSVNKSNKTKLYKITQGELAKKYNYDIYYYGLEDVKIKIDNTEIDLKEALSNNKVTMEQIIEQAEADKENEVINADMYKEGGTMIYWYGTYTIIKSHSLDGNRDVYIGIPEMNLNSVR